MLSTATQLSKLIRREADIAVRLVKPIDLRPDSPPPDQAQAGPVRRKILPGKTRSNSRQQEPRRQRHHHLPAPHRPHHAEKICGLPITNARVTMEVSSAMMMLEATRAGLGIAELATHLAENDPLLTRLWPEREDSYDVWLVMHGDLARTARVRAVADAIIGCFPGKKSD